jgi:hypothetical protein
LKVFDNTERSTLTAMHIIAKPIITFLACIQTSLLDKAKNLTDVIFTKEISEI